MQPLTTLKLGDFTFSGTEIPERLPFGSEQMLAVHLMVGGVKVIDAMGVDRAPIEWSGVLFGSQAMARARYLDWLCASGQQLALSWSDLAYTVVIRSFRPTYVLEFNVPYTIVCEVVEQTSQPVKTAPPSGVDVWVSEDVQAASGLASAIGDGPLSSAVAALDSAISAVSSFANATQATINSVLGPVQAVQSRVQVLLASASNTISNAATLGGVLPNNPISTQVARISGQLTAMTQAPLLLQLNSVVGRVAANVGQAGAGASLSTAGGNLFNLAAKAYGDATEWATIARANGLSDPMLVGINTLQIPAQPGGLGGVAVA